uniref:Lipocalin/cytosolic fatty-acid binding domain-containing protein n=1 Tax=Trichuris muris TaxID=70415 RepID=A0A5S6QRK0_TRIMR
MGRSLFCMTDWAGDSRLIGPGIDLIVDAAYPVDRAEELAELSTDWAVDIISAEEYSLLKSPSEELLKKSVILVSTIVTFRTLHILRFMSFRGLFRLLLIFAPAPFATSPQAKHGSFFGIPVPGYSMSAVDVLQLYVKSCRGQPEGLQQAGILSSAVKLMANGHVEELMKQLHSELFSSVQQVNVSKLTGKWHRVFDSADVDAKDCNALYATVVQETNLTASVSVKEYYQAAGNNGTIRTVWGNMVKMGPDPAGFLFFRGRDEDICPYFVVLAGPSDGNQYEYMILSHLFKAPVIVLCRDWLEFHYRYQDTVNDFLSQHKFFHISGKDDLKEKITYRDLSKCSGAFYNHF